MPTKLTNLLSQFLPKMELGGYFFLKKSDYNAPNTRSLAKSVRDQIERNNLGITVQTEAVGQSIKVKRVK